MIIFRVPLELAGADAHKGQPVPVGLVHVCLDLENESREIRAEGVDGAAVRHPGQRRGGQLQKSLQERLNAEVRQSGAEEHRAQLALTDLLQVHFPAGGQKLHIVNELLMLLFTAQVLRHLRIVKVDGHFSGLILAGHAGKEQQLAILPVVHPLEILAGSNRPVHGVGLDAQLPLQLIQQVEGVLGLPVHFVDEGENGNVPHGADLKELPGLGLHALGTVDDHDGRIRSHQGPIGVLGEVLVTRGIQNIDAIAVILELHNGRGNGNTALLFDLHPVGGSGPGVLLPLDHTGLGNGPTVKQEFFCQSGFTGVRVGDDGKGAAAFDFFFQC